MGQNERSDWRDRIYSAWHRHYIGYKGEQLNQGDYLADIDGIWVEYREQLCIVAIYELKCAGRGWTEGSTSATEELVKKLATPHGAAALRIVYWPKVDADKLIAADRAPEAIERFRVTNLLTGKSTDLAPVQYRRFIQHLPESAKWLGIKLGREAS